MPELDVYPIAVAVESRYALTLPFQEGVYNVPRKKKYYEVHIREPNERTDRQKVLVCFPGVNYDFSRSPSFKIDHDKVEEFYNKVVLKKRDLMTRIEFEYRSTRYEEIHGDNRIRRTREIPYELDVAVYELAVETINEFILASKCVVKGIADIPLFDEDYISALYHRDSRFYDYIPGFSQAGKIRRRKIPLAMGLPSGLFTVTQEEFKKEILKVLRHRKKYAIDEMLVSANRAFSDGEYEASLIIFESVFEAMVKKEVIKYYETKSFPSEAARKAKLDKVLKNGIRDLLKDEYPKCSGSKKFDKSVVQYRKWDKIYIWRNEVAHGLQDKGRLTKNEALRMFNDFQKIFRYLFNLESSYR